MGESGSDKNYGADCNKWFLLYIVAFVAIFAALIPSMTLDPDNGTHALLSLFYKNLAESTFNSILAGDISFQKVYDFSISYLVHYPKLQVFYPPLYHIVTGLVFYNLFGVSAWSAGMCNLMFAVLAMCTLYVLATKMFDARAALVAVVLFSLFSPMLTLTGRPMMEHTAMFFLFLSLLAYVELRNSGLNKGMNEGAGEGTSSGRDKRKKDKREKSGVKGYVLLAVVAVLACLSKQAAFFIFPAVFLHLMYKKEWKRAAVFFVASALLIFPYAFVVWKVGGLEINQTIWERYAYESFVWYFFLEYPPLFILVGGLAVYMLFSKDKSRSVLGMWFVVFLVGMLLISFKYRYFTYFLIPGFIVTGHYISKMYSISKLCKAWTWLFLIVYVAFAVQAMIPTLAYYPISETAREIYDNSPGGTGVAMLSEGDYFYSSALMFNLDSFDSKAEVKKELFVYRPCAFSGMNSDEITEFFKKNNIYYVVAVPGENGYESLDGIRGALTQALGGYVELYKTKDFELNVQSDYCNSICLIGEGICTGYKNPFDVFKL